MLAIAAFATGYINWTAADGRPRGMRALAQLSVGQARSAMALAAAQTAQDYELSAAGSPTRARSRRSPRCSGARRQYVVVTREQTTATNTTAYQGLARPGTSRWPPSRGSTTGGWAVSGWQPEN